MVGTRTSQGTAAAASEQTAARPARGGSTRTKGWRWRQIKHGWQLYVMLALPLLYLAIYKYGPIWGVQIAFRNYNPVQGITGSPWVGFAQFDRFIHSVQFVPIVR